MHREQSQSGKPGRRRQEAVEANCFMRRCLQRSGVHQDGQASLLGLIDELLQAYLSFLGSCTNTCRNNVKSRNLGSS